MKRISVYRQGASIYALGTDDVQEACHAAGITPDTHRWAGTDYGLYVRRQGSWQARSVESPPKDARPGVCFHGPITRKDQTDE